MSGHTPGPWVATRSIPEEGFDVWWIENERGLTITEVPAFYHRKNGEAEAEANAHLISAATDMLDALEEIISYTGGADNALDDEYVMARVFAAIDKARNE